MERNLGNAVVSLLISVECVCGILPNQWVSICFVNRREPEDGTSHIHLTPTLMSVNNMVARDLSGTKRGASVG
jgi:hypothetical protein